MAASGRYFVQGLLKLILAIDDWAKTIDHGSQADVAIFDFSKAFDSVPHKRLLAKLEYYGISGNG